MSLFIVKASFLVQAVARVLGVSYTPDWVSDHLGPWLAGSGNLNRSVALPATLAEGQADGRIPSNAIDWQTGNGGGQFATVQDWFQAGIDNDAPLALGTDLDLSSSDFSARHLARGLYGYGAQMPKFIWPTDLTTWASARIPLWKHDVVIRGIEWVGYSWGIRSSRELIPLTIGGVLDTGPYHSGSDETFNRTRMVASSFGTVTARVGEFKFESGSGDINQITIYRRPSGANENWSGNWDAWLVQMEGYVDGVNDNFPTLLSAPVTSATPTTLAAAINAGTATHGFDAVVDGDRVLLCTATRWIEPLRMEVETTGTLVVSNECRLPGIDVSCCKFTNGKAFMGGCSNTSALGEVTFLHNVGVGSWGAMAFNHMRRTKLRIANNYWGDCTGSRAMPAGNGTNAYNSILFYGTNYYMMSYLGTTDEIIEHNDFHDCTSTNNTDTNNCAVGIDIRANSVDDVMFNRGVPVGQCHIRWNKFVNLQGTTGAEDANAIYGKLRGANIEDNYFENCGAAWVSNGAFDGSEATHILIKEALSTDEMPELVIRGNIHRNPKRGIPVIKVDYQRQLLIEYESIHGWDNTRDGINAGTDGAKMGMIRITGTVKDIVVRSLDLQNVNPRGQPMLFSVHNVNLNSATFELSNIDIKNDGSSSWPEFTADQTVFRFNVGTGAPADPAAYFAASTMGNLNLLAADGSVVGEAKLIYTNSGLVVTSPENAADLPYSAYEAD